MWSLPVSGHHSTGHKQADMLDFMEMESAFAIGVGRSFDVIACSLSAEDADQRSDDWQAMMSKARSISHGDEQVRAVFEHSPQLAASLAELCAKESECCTFFKFGLEITAEEISLSIVVPKDAGDLLPVLIEQWNIPTTGVATV